MITLTREEAQQVLVVLEYPDAFKATTHAQTAALLRTRIAQPEPEPWGGVDFDIKTAPPQREWQGLTAYEIQELHLANPIWGDFACAIEAKLKEKNT
jgi:hypothetical protein